MDCFIADLLLFEEADDDIDPLGSPSGNLVVEPVARTRAGHDPTARPSAG
jgi:hypothetical protein